MPQARGTEVQRYGPRNCPEQTEVLLSMHWHIYQAIKLFCHAESVSGISRNADVVVFSMQQVVLERQAWYTVLL
jgi:hypothetical protein